MQLMTIVFSMAMVLWISSSRLVGVVREVILDHSEVLRYR